MPTHRDHPWERDARASGVREHPDYVWERDGRSVTAAPPRVQPTWRIPIAIAVIGVAGLIAIFKIGAELPDARAVPASSQPSGERVTRLRTRFLDARTLEVWGRTSAPDGTSVRLHLRADKARARTVREAPAARRRFYAKVRLPRALRGRPLRVTARIAR